MWSLGISDNNNKHIMSLNELFGCVTGKLPNGFSQIDHINGMKTL